MRKLEGNLALQQQILAGRSAAEHLRDCGECIYCARLGAGLYAHGLYLHDYRQYIRQFLAEVDAATEAPEPGA